MLRLGPVDSATSLKSSNVIPLKLPRSNSNWVWLFRAEKAPLLIVPLLHSSIFIFFGSLSLSVQNNKSSIIFIPVIISPENLKTAYSLPKTAW